MSSVQACADPAGCLAVLITGAADGSIADAAAVVYDAVGTDCDAVTAGWLAVAAAVCDVVL